MPHHPHRSIFPQSNITITPTPRLLPSHIPLPTPIPLARSKYRSNNQRSKSQRPVSRGSRKLRPRNARLRIRIRQVIKRQGQLAAADFRLVAHAGVDAAGIGEFLRERGQVGATVAFAACDRSIRGIRNKVSWMGRQGKGRRSHRIPDPHTASPHPPHPCPASSTPSTPTSSSSYSHSATIPSKVSTFTPPSNNLLVHPHPFPGKT